MNKLIFISLIFFVTLLSSVRGDRTTDRLAADPFGERGAGDDSRKTQTLRAPAEFLLRARRHSL